GAHEVETQAKLELDELLKLPGGSIGLAGPRGAGKTTLINLAANRPAAGYAKACSVLCSAPVEYDGRDYLVTLFLLLCQWVRGPAEDERIGSQRFRDRPAPVWS